MKGLTVEFKEISPDWIIPTFNYDSEYAPAIVPAIMDRAVSSENISEEELMLMTHDNCSWDCDDAYAVQDMQETVSMIDEIGNRMLNLLMEESPEYSRGYTLQKLVYDIAFVVARKNACVFCHFLPLELMEMIVTIVLNHDMGQRFGNEIPYEDAAEMVKTLNLWQGLA